MTAYWTATAAVWLAVMAYATPGALAAAVRQSERRGDPMRLAVWLVGLVMVGGVARWFWQPANVSLWKAVYVVAILTGCYVFRLMTAYGRGDPVRACEGQADV